MKTVMLFLFLLLFSTSNGQSLQHPTIWGTASDKAEILAKIEDYTWAKKMFDQAKSRVDAQVNTHQTNPEAILNTIPEFPANDELSEADASPITRAHTKVLSAASCAGLLYYLTEEGKYAQFAADIFVHYAAVLAARTPETTTISGNNFYDPRTTYAQLAIAYDYIYNYLQLPSTSVYQQSSGNRVAYDHAQAQKAIKNVIGNALKEYGNPDTYGRRVSNHPVLKAPGVLFPILCVEDDTERERLFKVFWEIGTSHQASFSKTVLPMFGTQGVWPEPISYGFMPNITMVLNIIDRIKPEMNVMANHMNILEGNFLMNQLRHPDRRFVRYGDSKRNTDGTETLFRFTLNLAERRGFVAYAEKSKIALRQTYDVEGGYNTSFSNSTFDNYDCFTKLHWNVPIPETISGNIDFSKPSVIMEHAGVALQRNEIDEDNEKFGLCGIIGGAHYVHSHVTGITMELYGAGHVMAANAGLPRTLAERRIPEHRDYFLRHAGNNTIVINGETRGIQPGSWGRDLYVWQNTTINEAAEPKHLENPVSPNFSFATQFLDDEVNDSDQQRTLSVIRTSPTTGYYFDLFRSKSLKENNFQDYIYHNIGDATRIFDSNEQELSTSLTGRYNNDIGDLRKSPGWRFFENTRVTQPHSGAVKIRFDVLGTNTYMNLFAPAGIPREYTKALGPGTREARGRYRDEKTQIMAIRQQGEAWDRPFVHIFEPSMSKNTSVQSVEYIYRDNVIVGAVVNSEVGDKMITDYVICQEDETKRLSIPELALTFDGRFAVVRREQDQEKAFLTLYVGAGNRLSFGEHALQTDSTNKGVFKVEVARLTTRIPAFQKHQNISVYPNPVSEMLTISLDGFKKADIAIYNLTGQLIHQERTSDSIIEVNLGTASKPGMYLIRILDENKKAHYQKFIVQ